MDSSTELIQSLLPVFVVVSLGAPAAALGLIEGVGEAIAALLKGLSGVWSDRLGRRLPLTLGGYGIAAAAKILFPLAPSVEWVLAARSIDRVGKGLRGAPRDALVTDLTPPAALGTAFGVRQAMDTVGAILGPLLAVILMGTLHGDIRSVFWFALLPAVLAVAVLWIGVREPEAPEPGEEVPAGPPREDRTPAGRWSLPRLAPRVWALVAVGALLGVARFSEAFLLLDAERLGLPAASVPYVLLVMNVTYAASAYPSGVASDRHGRVRLIVLGIAMLVMADLSLWWATTPGGAFVGAALWGFHLGLAQGPFTALLAENTTPQARGTAFGAWHMSAGVAALIGNLVAGSIWDRISPETVFALSGVLAAVAGVALVGWVRSVGRHAPANVQQGGTR